MGIGLADISRMGPAAQKQIREKLAAKDQREQAPAIQSGTSKYRNVKAVRSMPNGEERVFDSQKEARRYDELMMLLRSGQIYDLRMQVQFTLQESYITAEGNRVRGIKYVADFEYRKPNGTKVIEDVKSKATETRVYKVKKKLMQEKFGICIREV